MRNRILNHVIFWIICTLTLTMFYKLSLPSFGVAFFVIIMVIPVHIFSFYTTAYWIIPKYLYPKKYIKLIIVFLCCTFISAFLFRIIEIFFADPYIYRVMLSIDPSFKWPKLDGSFTEQLLKTRYIVNALEQSNMVLWVALSLKFFIMWNEKKQAALQAELNYLKGQIHPHFLFNTLNNLYALTLNQSPQSPEVVLGLSNILRYMLYECNTESVLLTRDVEILKSYIYLEKIRYDKSLDISYNIKGNLDNYTIPPLLMIPLVENAFKHGISETTQEDAWINIDLNVNDNKLKFKVSNSKPLNKVEDVKKHFGNVGLNNVKKRLDILYKDTHHLTIFDEEDMFVAILELDMARHFKEKEKTAAQKNKIPQLNLQKSKV